MSALTAAPVAAPRLTSRSRASRSAPRRAARTTAAAAASAPSDCTFYKYHGLGNDFILVDNRDSPLPKLTSAESSKLCDRNFGIGGDGVIFACPPSNAGEDFSMRIYNSDGAPQVFPLIFSLPDF